MKDHVIREVVNEVTKVAREFHATEQLRERLRRAMEPLITAACGAPADEPAPRERAKSVKFKCQYGRQDEGNAEYDSWLLGRDLPIPVARFAPPCETCHGTGQNPAWPLSVCPQCEGTGKTRASQ